ncbi:cytochrome P450 [Skermania piniformis]|uniref:Cytochrome P450 n=1 Tax=Skermania pinensis TaxID=39122 RepID=A0ABX8SAV4_9ACTN|nr:cytochrome P450 [Skermania piniformis]QXQ14307.1 cytochrome P450 [Skermania piniformis]
MTVDELPCASTVDGVLFTAVVGVPSVVQGLFTKREVPVRVAGLVGNDERAFDTVQSLVRKYGPGPFRVRLAADEVVLAHDPDTIRTVLGGSPDPFAADFGSKRKGMVAFQPDALTLSRDPVWEQRRQFAEAVLETGRPLHTLAEPMLAAARDSAVRAYRAAGERAVGWAELNAEFQRLTRVVVFGRAAADDVAISGALQELMSEGNRTPGKTSPKYPAFLAQIQRYLDRAESDSLAGVIAEHPVAGVEPAGQVVHWLFAMGDTLAANATRALALLATHPQIRAEVTDEVQQVGTEPAGIGKATLLSGCLLEAMRLYPTTAMFGRVAIADVPLDGGAMITEGTQVIIPNLFNHRNPDRVPYADWFAPAEWVSGTAGEDWSFNFFSHGPQACPGAGMAVYLGTAFLAHLLSAATPRVVGFDPGPGESLPYGMDLYGLHFDFTN